MKVTSLMKALSDPTRLSIVQFLQQNGATCVCDIVNHLNQPQPTISRHLNHLKSVDLLSSERKGTWIWYHINADLPDWVHTIIRTLPTTNEQ